MHAPRLPFYRFALAVIFCLTCVSIVSSDDKPTLTKEQIKQFLLTAEVISSKQTSRGITHPWRLTLSDGTLTHDASFQAVDEHQMHVQTAAGEELFFVDSYKYNIAAYALAELLGVDDMMPVYVERKWKGNTGSLSWWLPVKMDEAERTKEKVFAPDTEAWNRQMARIRVFDQLVQDTDPNLTNVLIGPDWEIWRVDFSRAFRLDRNLRDPKGLVRCDRQLFERLKTLDANQVAEKTKHYLTKDEVKAVMIRRDKIVALFQQLIAEKGENEVLR